MLFFKKTSPDIHRFTTATIENNCLVISYPDALRPGVWVQPLTSQSYRFILKLDADKRDHSFGYIGVDGKFVEIASYASNQAASDAMKVVAQALYKSKFGMHSILGIVGVVFVVAALIYGIFVGVDYVSQSRSALPPELLDAYQSVLMGDMGPAGMAEQPSSGYQPGEPFVLE